MCGVTGAVRAGELPAEHFVTDAVRALHHRGPDASGTDAFLGAGLGVRLGHTRLSIIDLSASANMPMRSADGELAISYNGELYNYIELRAELQRAGRTFRTQSDTEVILEAWRTWGTGALPRFNGMFAFALHDRRAGTLWLVRDRFGVKPLYLAEEREGLHFASEAGVLARALGRRPDPGYVARGLHYWLYEDDTARAPYQGVEAVPAGCYIEIKAAGGRLTRSTHRWYSLVERVAAERERLATLSMADGAVRLRDLLDDAVRLRLRSDVPVAVSLSGGMDSSSVAALASRAVGGLRGFTFGHPEEPDTEAGDVAALAARHGFDVTYLRSRSAVLVDRFFDTLRAQDAPFVGLSIVAQHAVYRAVKDAGIKVLIGGQGGDEAFMGYQKFRVFELQRLFAERRVGSMAVALWHLGRVLTRGQLSFRMLLRQRARYRTDEGIPALPGLPSPEVAHLGYDPTTPLWERQAADVLALSLPTLLRYEDRNSMANSVESRLPFVDYRIVEFGVALPEALKLRNGLGKWALRESMTGLVPDQIRLARIKRAFDVDVGQAVSHGLGPQLRERLEAARDVVREATRSTESVAERYADHHLVADPVRMGEAISLVWLGQGGGW
jgi:asparagine synthase (glutamine-hydrolysing)